MENSTTFTANNGQQYDNHDLTYTNHLKHLFNLCDSKSKEEFNDYNTIMLQDVFSRFELLDVTDKFEKIKKTENTRMWDNFVENAFNYRPHQPCCIQ